MPHPLLTQGDIDAFQRDGVILVNGLFADHLETLRAGIARNIDAPVPYATETFPSGEAGRFRDDYFQLTRIQAYKTPLL